MTTIKVAAIAVRRIGLSRDQLQEEVRALRHELANLLWKARQ